MIRRAFLTIAFAATLLITAPASTADADWQSHFADSVRALQRRDFDAAEVACRAAIDGAEAANVTGQRHESLIVALATILARQSEFADAADAYGRVIALRSERIGADHPELAQLLLDGAIARSTAGDPADAKTMVVRAIEIREQHFGAEDRRVIDALVIAAIVDIELSDYETAEHALLRVETARNGAEGARERLARHLSGLARQKQDEGDAAATATLARRAITNRGDENAMSFDGLFDLAGDYRRLGYASCSLDAWSDASEAFRRVIELTETSFGQPMDRDALFFWMCTARNEHRDAADAFLRTFRTARTPGYGDDWMGQMIAMLLGETPAHDVIANAASVESPAREDRLAEAHFFAATLHALADDNAAALEDYAECVVVGRAGASDVVIATNALRRAGVEPAPPADAPMDLDLRIAATRSRLITVRSQLEMLNLLDDVRAASPFAEQWKMLIDDGLIAEAPANALSPDDVATRIVEIDVAGACGVNVSPQTAGWVWNSADGILYASGLDH